MSLDGSMGKVFNSPCFCSDSMVREREFLFLFPIGPYVDDLARRLCAHGGNPDNLNAIIDARYRRQGYGVNWLLFSPAPRHPRVVMRHVSSWIQVCEEDAVLSAGVTIGNLFDEKVYPDPLFVLAQLPSRTKELVVAGFHQQDCVDRIAAKAHEIYDKVFVDEDLTERFYRRAVDEHIPLIRDCWDAAAVGIDALRSSLVDRVREYRSQRPWLVQIE